MSPHVVRTLALCGALALTACKDTNDPGGTPTTIEVVTAAPPSAAVNTAVTPGPAFVVKNQSGQAMKASVSIAVTAGGGTLVGQPTQSAARATGIGTWTLGKTAGANTVTVTVAGLTPVTFTVTGNAGPPNKLVDVSSGTKIGLANALLANPVLVSVQDTFSNPIAGQIVNFSILAGGGFLTSSPTATTDTNGTATATWTLGKSRAPQTLRAIVGTLNPLDISATVQSSYDIVVRFFGVQSMTPAQQSLFTAAAQRIMGIITSDMADVAVTSLSITSCVANQAALTETIDDIVIYAAIDTIDGPGNILASAGPCFVRTPGNTPILGVMRFDNRDLNTLTAGGSLQEVITHEMMHVLGVGSLWGSCSVCFNFVTSPGTTDPRYTAAQARAGCVATGGSVSCANTVPVEGLPAGPGTRDSHWRETTFGSELMTGFINASPNPISSITIGAIQDLGYTVNSGNNDGYTISAGSIVQNSLRAISLPQNWERLNHVPLYSIDAYGNVRLVRNPQ